MAKLRSLLWFAMLSSSIGVTVLSSCTISESTDDDDDGGQGGEQPGAGRGGNTNGGTSGDAGEGGASGDGGSGAPGGAGGAGGAGDAGAAGNAGAGGAPSDNACDLGLGGQGAYGDADGETCTDYCVSLFAGCSAYTDDAAYATEEECMRFCQNFSNEQLCCRAFHVMRVGDTENSTTDCLEAAGAGDECG